MFRLVVLPGLLLLTPLTGALAQDRPVSISGVQLQAAGVQFSAAGPVAESAGTSPGGGASLRLSGRVVVPNASLDVVLAPVSGRVEALLVNPGEEVRAGQSLVRIRSPEVLSLQRGLLEARSRFELAHSRADRDALLLEEGIIARNRMLESKAAEAQAEALLHEQEQLLQMAGFSGAAAKRIRAAGDMSPVVTLAARRAGQVLHVDSRIGQAVSQGDPLLQVASLDELWVELQASREQAAIIRTGDPATVAGCPLAGRVIATSRQLEEQSQMATVRITIPRGAGCLSPNQYVETRVAPRPGASDLLGVPDSAVVQHQGHSYVFIQRTGELFPVEVTVERRAGGQAWVRGKLRAGEQVASSGLATIKGTWLGLGTGSAP